MQVREAKVEARRSCGGDSRKFIFTAFQINPLRRSSRDSPGNHRPRILKFLFLMMHIQAIHSHSICKFIPLLRLIVDNYLQIPHHRWLARISMEASCFKYWQ